MSTLVLDSDLELIFLPLQVSIYLFIRTYLMPIYMQQK
jgi:hypothetical protein